ncbi:MAG: M20 family metallopeptidase [Methanomassiliicoccales archaeon]|jgi:acetylornithine deacetylase/succinyl-diaminopimelate desuccinylase-like protein
METLIDLLLIESDYTKDKREMIDYVVGWLRNLGLEVDLIGDPACPAISAYNGYNGIAFSGHLDTVPIGSNWTYEQGEVEGSRVYGRGAADMKGGCACMLHAAKALIKDDIDFYMLFTTDEEMRMTGAKSLLHTHAVKNANGLVIGEPTGMRVAYKEKGVSQFDLHTKGRTAHASMPWLGDNAIMKMNKLLTRVDEYTKEVTAAGNELTLGVTVINGGEKSNVIPDWCKAELDVRTPYPMQAKDVAEALREKFDGLEYELRVPHEVPAFQTSPGSPLLQAAIEHLGTEAIEVPYATEAAIYCSEVKDILICGPGDLKLAHAPDEYVEKAQMNQIVDLYVHLAKMMAQG